LMFCRRLDMDDDDVTHCLGVGHRQGIHLKVFPHSETNLPAGPALSPRLFAQPRMDSDKRPSNERSSVTGSLGRATVDGNAIPFLLSIPNICARERLHFACAGRRGSLIVDTTATCLARQQPIADTTIGHVPPCFRGAESSLLLFLCAQHASNRTVRETWSD
jgi:hypothetical protein